MAGNDDGFTLIEVLVAFVIVALGLGTFYSTMGDVWRWSSDSALREETLVFAQSQLAALGTVEPIIESKGQYANGSIWRLSAKMALAATEATTQPTVPVFVTLVAEDPRGRPLFKLTTVKLQRRTP
jgi:prepilin-type N-terminal cleavage/methylation domain-containing protein